MVLTGTIRGSHVQDAYRALLGGPLVVVDPGRTNPIRFRLFPIVTPSRRRARRVGLDEHAVADRSIMRDFRTR